VPMDEDQLSTKGTVSPVIRSSASAASQVRPVVFTVLGTGIFGFILWGISEFLSLRGVVNLAASRIILLLIWLASTLGACAVVAHTKIRRKVLAIVLSSVVLAFALLALDTWAPKPSVHTNAKPDVALRFVNAKDPFLVVTNLSDAEARNMKWAVELWNMDLPDRNDPLPIPISTFDWLKAHSEGGPQNLFDAPPVTSLLRPGNRLFGSAVVDCPECSVGRTYVVYIKWGEGGWFSEVASLPSAKLVIPKNFMRETREAYFRQLEAMVPLDRRAEIPHMN